MQSHTIALGKTRSISVSGRGMLVIESHSAWCASYYGTSTVVYGNLSLVPHDSYPYSVSTSSVQQLDVKSTRRIQCAILGEEVFQKKKFREVSKTIHLIDNGSVTSNIRVKENSSNNFVTII